MHPTVYLTVGKSLSSLIPQKTDRSRAKAKPGTDPFAEDFSLMALLLMNILFLPVSVLIKASLNPKQHMKRILSITIASILAISIPCISKAQLSFTATIGGIPTVSDATLETFDETTPSILTLSGYASLETGPITGGLGSGLYVPPYFSGSTAPYFGETQSGGYDSSQFVAVAPGGSATLSFATPQNYFGIFWGSLDANVGQGTNYLTFYDNANNVIGTISAADVLASNSSLIDGSSLGPDGAAYINITSTVPFSEVIATSTFPSFEFDDVAYAQVVPEPSSVLLVSLGLACLSFGIRRRWGSASGSRKSGEEFQD